MKVKKKETPRTISFAEAKERCGQCSSLVKDGEQWWCDNVDRWINQIINCRYWPQGQNK